MIFHYSTSSYRQQVSLVLLTITTAALVLFSAPSIVAAEVPPPSPITRELLNQGQYQQAMELAMTIADEKDRWWTIYGVAKIWAKAEVEKTTAFAQTINKETERSLAMYAVADFWIKEDVEKAAAFIQTMVVGSLPWLKVKAISDLAQEWADKDYKKAAVWAATLEDGEGRRNALYSVAHSWAEKDPENAAVWAVTLEVGESTKYARD